MADQANIPAHSPGQQGGNKNQQATNTPAPLGDGGPSFPVPMIPYDPSGGFTNVEWQGLSLRDYFAAKAMLGELITSSSDATPESTDALIKAAQKAKRTPAQQIAFNAYQMADAMLAARKAVRQ